MNLENKINSNSLNKIKNFIKSKIILYGLSTTLTFGIISTLNGCGRDTDTKLVPIYQQEEVYQCNDGIDNDSDGFVDNFDLGCYADGVYYPDDNDEIDPIVSKEIVINEFEQNPISGSEWVELYNPNSTISIDISEWQIWDLIARRYIVPTGTILNPEEFYTFNLTNVLNNGGETITLYDPNRIIIIDQTPNLAESSSSNNCWARVPNGVDTDTLEDFVFQTCTQGTNNDEPPIISDPCSIYDNFSSSTLDVNKWTIKPDTTGAPSSLTDIYEVNIINQNYNIAQTFSGSDKGTVLTMNKLFNAGETVDLEIIYNSGSGNQEGKPYFNGIPLDLVMAYAGYDCGGCPTSGDIGYWNGNSEVSNTLGLHHLWVEFNGPSNTKITFTRPDLTNFTYTATTITYPVEFGVGLRTGGNGIASYSFDNFEICTY